MAFTFDIVTPKSLAYSNEVEQVTVPGAEGEFGVLDLHAPFISTLQPGVIVVASDSGQSRFFISGGFAEVADNRLSILAVESLDLSTYQSVEAATRLEDAEAALKDNQDEALISALTSDVTVAKALVAACA